MKNNKQFFLDELYKIYESENTREQLDILIRTLILYSYEVENKTEFIINLRDFLKLDIEQEFQNE